MDDDTRDRLALVETKIARLDAQRIELQTELRNLIIYLKDHYARR